MASDRTRELAIKWLREQGENQRFVGDFRPDHVSSLTTLLDAFEREVRGEEAKWWQASCNVECNGCAMTEGYPDKRIAALAAPPTPEVKK